MLLDVSANGLVYVEDGDGGMYEIDAFLGDMAPNCQVFRAQYSTWIDKHATDDENQLTSNGEKQVQVDPQVHVVALKLMRVEERTAEFVKLRRQVENSLTIGPMDDQENKNVVTANNTVLGIYKFFYYGRKFLCVSMPYWDSASIRYIINTRIPDRKVADDKFIAAVLRETLKGLCILHGRGNVHGRLNAGNIFAGIYNGSWAIKLAYEGSTYFHNPGCEGTIKIWNKEWSSTLSDLLCTASAQEENRFWRSNVEIYEPSINEQHNYNYIPASDIWNFGVTALELAFGPLIGFRGYNARSMDQLRSVLGEEEGGRLPTLQTLFLSDGGSGTRRAEWPINLGFQEGPSSLFTAMVKRCLALDPHERPSAAVLLNDPFFKENQDVDLQYFASVIASYPQIR
ncbi:hypothetical protein ACH5RR_030575 [Cinchona calisaya]|uniref:Protein kinase domain-containing protein n=1 Tax=Cinchona calisaya TaxID=153742 RepID=A0ABD2YWC5_9GENT